MASAPSVESSKTIADDAQKGRYWSSKHRKKGSLHLAFWPPSACVNTLEVGVFAKFLLTLYHPWLNLHKRGEERLHLCSLPLLSDTEPAS